MPDWISALYLRGVHACRFLPRKQAPPRGLHHEVIKLFLIPALQTNPMKTIDTGELSHTAGHKVGYSVVNGWSVKASFECDRAWGRSTVEFLDYIARQGFSGDELEAVLLSMQTEDSHWRWFDKSIKLTSDEYEWFYLYAEGKPQGACVIYHPKESVLTKTHIFYVEFIAVAPWNRKCSIRERELAGVGSTLLRVALKFSVQKLKLSPGFSLHSLPQTVLFYRKLKMVNIKECDKGPLAYFELPAALATEMMGVA